jgi:hypothetical protein
MNIAVSGEGSPDTKGSMLINGAMQAHHVHLGYIAIFTVLKFCNFFLFLSLGIFLGKLLHLSIFGSISLGSCTFLHLVTHRFVCNFRLDDVQLGKENDFSCG